MTTEWLSPDQIADKRGRGEALTAWETSVYRLNFRDDGTRYSSNPEEREAQYEADNAVTMRQRRQRRAS